MRVMHLADLHLGKSVLGQSMIEDQEYILKKVVQSVEERQVDVILICGDVYDKAVPNIEAIDLFNRFLTRLCELNKKIFVISGNHDSKERLSFGNALLRENGLYIEGIYDGKLKCYCLDDEYGKFYIYMLPFVKPYDVRLNYPDEVMDSYDDAIRVVMKNVSVDVKERNLIMLHQFVTASGVEVERSESEIISLGGIDCVDVHYFDDFDYVAMGHVHGSQKLLRDTVRYGGSPLKYSFSEVFHHKKIPIVEFREKGNVEIEYLTLEPLRDMRVIRGNLEQLLSREVISLENPSDYIQVILTDEDYVLDAIGKLRQKYNHVLKLEYSNQRTNSRFMEVEEKINKNFMRDEFLLFEDFYKKQNGLELDDERCKILRSIIHDVKDE